MQGSRNAPLLASGAQDGTVCLWDSSSGRRLQQLQAHEANGNGWVMALLLARHEDGKSGLMLSASYDRTIRVWAKAADELSGGPSPRERASGVFGASASCMGGSAIGGASGMMGGASAMMASGSNMCGSHMNMNMCGSAMGGGGGPGGGGWVLQSTLEGHADGVLGLELSRSRKHAFSTSNDQTVRVWELASASCLQTLELHGCSVSAVGWHLASGCIATGGEDGTVHLWDVSAFDEAGKGAAAEAELVQSLNLEHCEVLCIVPSADGTAIFCGLDDGSCALLGGK